MFTTLDATDVHATPNATMRRYPGGELAVWRTEMGPSASGPVHTIDTDQVLVVVEGSVEVDVAGEVRELGPGDSCLLPAGVERHVVAGSSGTVTLNVSRAGGVARVGSGEPVVVPWSR